MPKLLLWIFGYGALLITSDVVSKFSSIKLVLDTRMVVSGWLGGVVMILAGLAAMQGRRSLRLTGLYVALFLPLALTAIFSWYASAEWRRIRSIGAPMLTGVTLTSLAVISVLMVAIISKLRPREGIASRGYSVTLPSIRRPTLSQATSRIEPRHSEAS